MVTVSMRGNVARIEKLEIEFGPKTGPRIKMFYTRSIRLVLNSSYVQLYTLSTAVVPLCDRMF